MHVHDGTHTGERSGSTADSAYNPGRKTFWPDRKNPGPHKEKPSARAEKTPLHMERIMIVWKSISKYATHILYGGAKPEGISPARWNAMVKHIEKLLADNSL